MVQLQAQARGRCPCLLLVLLALVEALLVLLALLVSAWARPPAVATSTVAAAAAVVATAAAAAALLPSAVVSASGWAVLMGLLIMMLQSQQPHAPSRSARHRILDRISLQTTHESLPLPPLLLPPLAYPWAPALAPALALALAWAWVRVWVEGRLRSHRCALTLRRYLEAQPPHLRAAPQRHPSPSQALLLLLAAVVVLLVLVVPRLLPHICRQHARSAQLVGAERVRAELAEMLHQRARPPPSGLALPLPLLPPPLLLLGLLGLPGLEQWVVLVQAHLVLTLARPTYTRRRHTAHTRGSLQPAAATGMATATGRGRGKAVRTAQPTMVTLCRTPTPTRWLSHQPPLPPPPLPPRALPTTSRAAAAAAAVAVVGAGGGQVLLRGRSGPQWRL